MKFKHAGPDTAFDTLPLMPGWVRSARGETLEDAAFSTGAALGHLHLVLGRAEVPQALLRERLALLAAEACVGFSGRTERAGDLRDILHLLRPGDLPGPAGETYQSWHRAVQRPVAIKTLHRIFGGALPGGGPDMDPATIARWLEAKPPEGSVAPIAPIAQVAAVLETVLTQAPRADLPALILGDAALAQALGWGHLIPLLAVGLTRSDLRKRGDDLQLACHRAVATSATEAVRLAADLARRVAALNAVAPKLRAKGAGPAVAMFLTRDAVAPSALPLPDRAARRLCDRLVALGGIRELTGRDTFRLYGV